MGGEGDRKEGRSSHSFKSDETNEYEERGDRKNTCYLTFSVVIFVPENGTNVEITRRSPIQILPLQPKQIPLLIQSCRQRYRYFTAKNIGRISTYKNKRCILGVFHSSCNAFLIVFIAPPQDLTQHSYRPIVKQPHFVKRLINEIIKIFQGIFS